MKITNNKQGNASETKLDLQLFNEAVQGRQIVYLYRLLSDAATEDGTILAFTTDNNRTVSKDAAATATKDGVLRTPGVAEVEITATSVMLAGDDKLSRFEDAMHNDELFEIWEANLADPKDDHEQFAGTYFQGYLTSWDVTSGAEDMVEVSLTFGINGTGRRGCVTVTEEQQEAADYVFKDTPATGA